MPDDREALGSRNLGTTLEIYKAYFTTPLGNVVCAIYVGLMETNGLVPWLRQSDHPIQKYHAPRVHAGQRYILDFQIFYCIYTGKC